LKVKDLMSRNVVTVTKEASIEEAIGIMYERHVGSIIVIDEKERCKGIFTNTDVLRVIVKKVPLDSKIEKAMSKSVVTISEMASFSEARELICRHRIRHLPVTNGKGYIVGILTVRSLFDEISGLRKGKL